MFMLWQKWNAKFFLLFVGLMGVTEIVIILRWRATLACSVCGFDPILYITQREKLVERVKQKLELRRNNPDQFLSSRRVNIPTRVISKKDEELKNFIERKSKSTLSLKDNIENKL